MGTIQGLCDDHIASILTVLVASSSITLCLVATRLLDFQWSRLC